MQQRLSRIRGPETDSQSGFKSDGGRMGGPSNLIVEEW